jgi:hypothetical protein
MVDALGLEPRTLFENQNTYAPVGGAARIKPDFWPTATLAYHNSVNRIIALRQPFLAVIGLTASATPKQSLDALWRSEGHRFSLEIQGSKLKSFEVTAATCMLGRRRAR